MPGSIAPTDPDFAFLNEPYNPLYNPLPSRPILVHQRNDCDRHVFIERPWFAHILFDNDDSDARDHCAAERTFLSWLRLATYMAVVAVAIIISFHLKNEPSAMEKRVALPFGLIFWFLALACLISGLSNYIKTVNRYSRRQALVQSGVATQVVFSTVACAIIAACILFLSTNATTK